MSNYTRVHPWKCNVCQCLHVHLHVNSYMYILYECSECQIVYTRVHTWKYNVCQCIHVRLLVNAYMYILHECSASKIMHVYILVGMMHVNAYMHTCMSTHTNCIRQISVSNYTSVQPNEYIVCQWMISTHTCTASILTSVCQHTQESACENIDAIFYLPYWSSVCQLTYIYILMVKSRWMWCLDTFIIHIYTHVYVHVFMNI